MMAKRKPEPIANCPACKKFLVDFPWDGKRHVGAEVLGHGEWNGVIQCAFDESGVFTTDNWMCATLSPYVRRAWEVEATSFDQHAAVLPIGGDLDRKHAGDFIVLCYYKRCGRVEGAYFLSDEGMRPLLLSDLL